MGFNKRYISMEYIHDCLKNNVEIEEIFTGVDSLIFKDEKSQKIYDLFVKNKSFKHLLKK